MTCPLRIPPPAEPWKRTTEYQAKCAIVHFGLDLALLIYTNEPDSRKNKAILAKLAEIKTARADARANFDK